MISEIFDLDRSEKLSEDLVSALELDFEVVPVPAQVSDKVEKSFTFSRSGTYLLVS